MCPKYVQKIKQILSIYEVNLISARVYTKEEAENQLLLFSSLLTYHKGMRMKVLHPGGNAGVFYFMRGEIVSVNQLSDL